MDITVRQARPEDAAAAGPICYAAFHKISTEHTFPPDFPNAQVAVGFLSMMFGHPGFYAIVAERGGTIIGSNVLDERSQIAGIGPITVDPAVQNSGTGRQLMLQVMERARARNFPGVRLVQAAFHNRSLSLYTKLGFDPREPLSCLQGPPIGKTIPGYRVRIANESDVAACNRLCLRVHGHTREGELRDAIMMRTAHVVEHDGRLTGYTTGIAFFAHTVAETNHDLQALIAAAPEFGGPGLLLPTRNAEVLRWCLNNGLRVVQPMTLMTLGLYNEPCGAYLPSILY